MSTILRRIPALLVSGCILAALGSGVASARMSGPQTFKPTEGMIYLLGSKRAIGYFLTSGGNCQVTLMIAEAVDPDVAQPPSAARMSFGMVPGQSMALGSAEGESMVATCGAGGETLQITRNKPVRS
jgi:hypothetical protein